MNYSKIKNLHLKALKAAQVYKKSEHELLEVLIAIDREKVFLHYDCSSLTRYAIDILNLSESMAPIFVAVARKSRLFPEIFEKIKEGRFSVSQAKRLVPILTDENKELWLKLAEELTQKSLEREIAANFRKGSVKTGYVHPEDDEGEKVSMNHVSASDVRVKLEMGISQELMLKFRRAQDLISSQKRRNVDLEQTLSLVLDHFIIKNDPVKKAERQMSRGKLREENKEVLGRKTKECLKENRIERREEKHNEPGTGRAKKKKRAGMELIQVERRVPIPASIKHRLQLKAKGRCSYVGKSGQRCTHQRFLEVHHVKPVAEGGSNAIENLELLCSAHHRLRHLQMGELEKKWQFDHRKSYKHALL